MTLKSGAQPPDFIARLMLRYWGIGENLDSDEKEVLMFALSIENEGLGGSIHKDAKLILAKRLAKDKKSSK